MEYEKYAAFELEDDPLAETAQGNDASAFCSRQRRSHRSQQERTHQPESLDRLAEDPRFKCR
jgi:hypothetical protein